MRTFLTALRKAFLSPSKPKRSYSQFAEDLVILSVLKESKSNSKFYVDIGCHHPKRGSNTYFFYKKGWNGLLVDLEDVKVLACKIARPRDQVIKAAVSDKKEKVTIFSPRQYSTNSTIRLDSIENSENYKDIGTIETSTLNELLEKCDAPRDFSFLNIDVEGADLQVLKSIDLNFYEPAVICIENWLSRNGIDAILSSEIHQYLINSKYQLQAWSGLSTIYLRKSAQK